MEKNEKMGLHKQQTVQATKKKGKGKRKGKYSDSEEEDFAKYSPEYDYIEAGNRLRQAPHFQEPRVAGLHFRMSI